MYIGKVLNIYNIPFFLHIQILLAYLQDVLKRLLYKCGNSSCQEHHATTQCSLFIFSADIERTGTNIALDAFYREGQSMSGKINVPMYVRTLRKDRMKKIQGEVS